MELTRFGNNTKTSERLRKSVTVLLEAQSLALDLNRIQANYLTDYYILKYWADMKVPEDFRLITSSHAAKPAEAVQLKHALNSHCH